MRATVRVMRVMQAVRVMQAIFVRIFFSSIGLGDWRSFHQQTSINSYKPPTRHLESVDDPGDEYKLYNLVPRVLSLSLRN